MSRATTGTGRTMTFTCEDMESLTRHVVTAWGDGSDRDWSARAGTLDWTCAATADHAVDTVFAPAAFLASRRQDDYPSYGSMNPGVDAAPEVLIEALEAASRILVATVRDTPSDVRAVLWRRPAVELRGPADFVPRAALELILHAHDVCTGLGVEFEPSAALCERLRDHTRGWPHWGSPGWNPLGSTGDPWADLLGASGRSR